MSNCLKCNHCGVIGVETPTVIGKFDGFRAEGWLYISKPSKKAGEYPTGEVWHLCPTCTGYFEVFMGERKPNYLSGENRYAYEVPATVEGPNEK